MAADGQERTEKISNYAFDRGFTGYVADIEAGLCYARARMYSLEAGRFLGRDPLGYLGGLNSYEYCSGSPANSVDPYGTIEWKVSEPVKHDLVENDQNGTLGTTKAVVNVKGVCDCKKNFLSSDTFTVSDASVEYIITVSYWADDSRYSVLIPGLTLKWVQDREREHVTDAKEWMNSVGMPAAENMLKNMKNRGLEYSSMASCVEAIETALESMLNSSSREAMDASGKKWDESGKHTWKRK